jgi:hypothetical protein
MNNWCICWFITHILLGILIFKGLSARRLYKSFGVKGLNLVVSLTPGPLYTRGDSPPARTEYEDDWSPKPVSTLWKREGLLPLPEKQPLLSSRPAHILITTQTELYRHLFLNNSQTSWSLSDMYVLWQTCNCTSFNPEKASRLQESLQILL